MKARATRLCDKMAADPTNAESDGSPGPGSSVCGHERRTCLNQHEIIRKYRCDDCAAVMMCACDEVRGKRLLSHQLSEGRDIAGQSRVPVTVGFQPKICSECRGLPADPAPAGEIYGRTSKIKRYYWRELLLEELSQKADWNEAHPDASREEQRAALEAIEAGVLEEIKALHARAPKYTFAEPSQSDILTRYGVQVIDLKAPHVATPQKGQIIADGEEVISAEEFVARHYRAQGWTVSPLESLPLHALFGVMMWTLIQDPDDPQNRMVAFGDRNAFEAKITPPPMIWTLLPEDFGTPAYASRRAEAIEEHFARLEESRDDLFWLFDYWRGLSEEFRQYLWAHRPADVDRARNLVEVFGADLLFKVLRFLFEDYWGRYLGWPDLLSGRGDELLLLEVKSSKDRLSQDQREWIAANHDHLNLPFKVVKLHRS